MTASDEAADRKNPAPSDAVPPGLEDVLRRAGLPPPPAPHHRARAAAAAPAAPPAPEPPAPAEPAAQDEAPAAPEPAAQDEAPAAPLPEEDGGAPEGAPAPAAAPKPKFVAEEVTVTDADVLFGVGTLPLHAAVKAAISRSTSPAFKVVALASGYTAEMLPLNFHEIARLQAQAVDAFAGRIKLLTTLHGRCSEFSCGPMKFQDWMKVTAQSDYDTLMYGVYAATYPGENDFDIGCRFCTHVNKVVTQVKDLARVEDDSVYGEIKRMLDPSTDFKGAIQKSLVGIETQRRLPKTGIVFSIRNPSIQDHMNGVQYFQGLIDKATGQLPPHLVGADTIRTIVLYTGKFLVPVQNGKFVAVVTPEQKADLIGKLPPEDGAALSEAIDSEVRRLQVSYKVPDFNCGACAKRNTDLFLDFENLLFTKMTGLS